MNDQAEFVCEPLEPVAGTFDAGPMSRGEPGLPARFRWRGQEYRVVEVAKRWKSSGPCRHGSEEMYLRRHWFEIITEPRARMTVYFDRQARDRSRPKARWWVYSATSAE